MFIGDERLLEISFPAARSGLSDLTSSGMLAAAARDAYLAEGCGPDGPGPLAAGPGAPGLATVRARLLRAGEGAAGLALRWEVSGAGGGLFPVLDGDVTLVAAGEHVTRLIMSGVYRPPSGAAGQRPGRPARRGTATTVITAFVDRIAGVLAPGPGPRAVPPGPGPIAG